MEALLALQSSLHCLAVLWSATADCDKASSPTNTAHRAKVGFITHVSGKTPPTPAASRPASARRKLPRWQPQCGPQPLTGSALLFALCSYNIKNKGRTGWERKTGGAGGPRRGFDCRRVAPAVNAR